MLVSEFLKLCQEIGFPVALDKTEWASDCITFLSILLNGRHFILSIPLEKRIKATVLELQTLCGFLNFIGKAIFPGRAFTRRMYSKYSNAVNLKGGQTKEFKLKLHHHVRLDAEFKYDCHVWLKFLTSELSNVVNRPMLDLSEKAFVRDIGFYSDASAAKSLGFGSILQNQWIFRVWGRDFMEEQSPSIEYLELFTLVVGILTWQDQIRDCRIVVHCDNQAVVSMVNNITSSCPNCMHLLRILVLNGLLFNRRVFAQYIPSKQNVLSDALSRLDFARFRKWGPQMNREPDHINPEIWPITKVWKNITK